MGNIIKYSKLDSALMHLGLLPHEMHALAKEFLDSWEYQIFQSRYGNEKSSLDEVGKMYGCSREWIRQKEKGIIKKIEKRALHKNLENSFIRGYRQILHECINALATAEVIVDKKEVTEQTEYARIKIDECEISARVHNCLKRAKIETLGDLAQKTELYILDRPNFGIKSLAELVDHLGKYDLEFGMKPEELQQKTQVEKKTYLIKKENLERIQHLKNSLLNKILDRKLTDLEMPNWFNKHSASKLGTLREIVQKTDSELLGYSGIGVKALFDIKNILARYGLRLGMKIPSENK
jgi:DNA-directed RNA polymerase alpha subunit